MNLLPPKSIAGLKILLKNEDIELGGRKYCWQDGEIYTPAIKDGEEILLGVDLSLAEFIKLCEKEDDTIYLQGLKVC